MGNLFWSIVIIAVLIVLNGIFSAGEFAIVSSRKSKIKEIIKEGKEKKAQALLQMREKPETFLSLAQIGITTTLTPETQAGLFDVVDARSTPARMLPHIREPRRGRRCWRW